MRYNGGSAAQSSTIQAIDIGLGIKHHPVRRPDESDKEWKDHAGHDKYVLSTKEEGLCDAANFCNVLQHVSLCAAARRWSHLARLRLFLAAAPSLHPCATTCLGITARTLPPLRKGPALHNTSGVCVYVRAYLCVARREWCALLVWRLEVRRIDFLRPRQSITFPPRRVSPNVSTPACDPIGENPRQLRWWRRTTLR